MQSRRLFIVDGTLVWPQAYQVVQKHLEGQVHVSIARRDEPMQDAVAKIPPVPYNHGIAANRFQLIQSCSQLRDLLRRRLLVGLIIGHLARFVGSPRDITHTRTRYASPPGVPDIGFEEHAALLEELGEILTTTQCRKRAEEL